MRQNLAAREARLQPAPEKKRSDAREQAVRDHRPLVLKLAREFKGRGPNRSEFDDLVQAGMIGVLRAVDTHDPDKGPLSKRVGKCVRNAMEAECGIWSTTRQPPRPALVFRGDDLRDPECDPFPEADRQALLDAAGLIPPERTLVDLRMAHPDMTRAEITKRTHLGERMQQRLEKSIAAKVQRVRERSIAS